MIQRVKSLKLSHSKYFSSLKSSWDPTQFTNDLISRYSQKSLCLYDLLIQRHPKNNIALYSGSNFQQHTYGEIGLESQKLFHLLKSLGVGKGSRVAVLLPKCANLMIAAAAIWRLGAVYVPLFTAFGHEAIGVRVEDGQVSVIISDNSNSSKLNHIRKSLPIHIVLTSTSSSSSSSSAETNFWVDSHHHSHRVEKFVSKSHMSDSPAICDPSDPIALLYTSGTTGLPKGVVIPAYSLASFHMYMQYGLGLQCGDEESLVSSWINPHLLGISTQLESNKHPTTLQHIYQRYYSSADTGWAYGFYYNLIGPLLLGIPITYPEIGSFSPHSLLKLLSECKVTHFSSSPSAYRSLRAFDLEEQGAGVSTSSFDKFPTPHLMFSSSAGEPLSSTLNSWWIDRMTSHRPLADHYGQSETGMLVNCHWGDCLHSDHTTPPKPLPQSYPIGSMGRSMPGYRCVTLNNDEIEISPESESCTGQLAVDIQSSPLHWFQGYWNQPLRTNKCHSKSQQYYLTGDLVHQGDNPNSPPNDSNLVDESATNSNSNSNNFWYISRNDDIITSSGYRIGPSDIERCLLKDIRVKDVGVYGVSDPDGLRGEIIVASVVLHHSIDICHDEKEKLTLELQKYVGENLSKHCKPKKILFRTTDLPRTPSGKIQRFKLREEFLVHK